MESPYRVPWIVERESMGIISLTNIGSEPLRGVTFTLSGPGTMPVRAPMNVLPGGRIQLRVRGSDLPRSTLLIVRWLRPNKDDYLWRVAF